MRLSHLPGFDYGAWIDLSYSEEWREHVVPLLEARRLCLMEELARTQDPDKAQALRGRIAEIGDVITFPDEAETHAAALAAGDRNGRGWNG